MEVVPINFGLKFKPPKLGLQYHLKNQPQEHFVHEIPLSFINGTSNADSITRDLFEKHQAYLNPKVIS